MARFWRKAHRSKSRATSASKRLTSGKRHMPELLRVEGLRAGYGEAVVINDASFVLARGESLALLGRNGVGKTTLLRTLVGLTRRHSGTIELDGHEITNRRPDQRAAAGIGWVPQERNIFKSLSVEENLKAIARPRPANPPRGSK